MVFDPVSESLWGAIAQRARDEDKKDTASGYWVKCPSCGKRVMKKQLRKAGCYTCGWKEGTNKASPYWMNCPNCRRQVVARELNEKGCFLCGWKPAI